MNIDHQAAINELEFRMEHQESQHQNELSDLEARLRNEMVDLRAKHQEEIGIMQQVRQVGTFVMYSNFMHTLLNKVPSFPFSNMPNLCSSVF